LHPIYYDKYIYKEHHIVECFFSKIKYFRPVFLSLISLLVILKHFSRLLELVYGYDEKSTGPRTLKFFFIKSTLTGKFHQLCYHTTNNFEQEKRKKNTMYKKISWSIILFSLTSIINTRTNQQPTIKLKPQEKYEDPFIRPLITDQTKKYFPITFSGYIKHEAFYDTRQVNGLGNDQIVFFPDKKLLDTAGQDTNAKGQGNMVAIETRLRATIHGPKINGAHSFGVIESDFFGFNEAGFQDIDRFEILNLFRMRHAFAQLDWEKYTLIFGQTWHPIYVSDCFPETISNNVGAPTEPFSRNPQIRFTYHNKRINIITAALSQIRFFNDGPDGFSSKYIRNAVVPNLHGQIQIKIGNHLIGTGLDYKRLVPRIRTNKGIKVRESINSIAAIWYACLEWPSFYFRTKIIFAENVTNFAMLSGYAVHTIDPVTDERTYTNLRTFAIWLDTAVRKSKKIEPGIFVGFTKNLGASTLLEMVSGKQSDT